MRRAQESDAATSRRRVVVVAVVGKRKNRVGEHEDEPAMAGVMPVEEFRSYRHRQPCIAERDRLYAHAKPAGAGIDVEYVFAGRSN